MFMTEQPFKRSGVTLLAAVLAKLPKFGSRARHLQRGTGNSRTRCRTAS